MTGDIFVDFKTLIHVNEMGCWGMALGSINNFLNAVDGDETTWFCLTDKG